MSAAESAAELLRIAGGEIIDLLESADPTELEEPSVCPGWRVKDVAAHVAGVLGRAAADRIEGFAPEDNVPDVEERADWSGRALVDELTEVVPAAAAAVESASGSLDGLGLGVWVHSGDIRGGLGIDDPYDGPGRDLALELLAVRSRALPFRLTVELTDRGLDLGNPDSERTAVLTAGVDGLVRLVAGRSPEAVAFDLRGATPAELLLFG